MHAPSPQEFETHPARGRFNSAFFWVMGGYINWHMRKYKTVAFAELPHTVVELGPGVGANVRYLPAEARLIAIEPNPVYAPSTQADGQRGRRRHRDPQCCR